MAQSPIPDLRSFDALFDARFDRLRRYAYRFLRSWDDADDVVHDVFLRLWERRAELGAVGDLTSYLYAAARHQAMNRLRRQRVEARWLERQTAEAPEPDDGLAAADLAAEIQRAVDGLPPRQREVIVLRWRQYSYDEIAAELGISPKTVAIHLARAMESLRKLLGSSR